MDQTLKQSCIMNQEIKLSDKELLIFAYDIWESKNEFLIDESGIVKEIVW